MAEDRRYPIPNKINLMVILLQLALTGGVFWGAAQAGAWWQLALLSLAFAIVGNSIYAIVHEAEHGILHANRRVNNALGVFMALFFPASFHLIRQGHLGHHYRNRSDDEAFDLYFDHDSRLLKQLYLYGIITGFYWLMVALSSIAIVLYPPLLRGRHFTFERSSAAFIESLNPHYWKLIWLECAAVILFHAAIVFALGSPLLNYAVVYAGFGFTWSAMQYVHHYGTERDVARGAKNLWLLAPIDWLLLHHNWHLTHHQEPTIPWIYLPHVGREKDPERGFLPLHYLRMWRGVKHASEHVENRFKGRVVQ